MCVGVCLCKLTGAHVSIVVIMSKRLSLFVNAVDRNTLNLRLLYFLVQSLPSTPITPCKHVNPFTSQGQICLEALLPLTSSLKFLSEEIREN